MKALSGCKKEMSREYKMSTFISSAVLEATFIVNYFSIHIKNHNGRTESGN